MKRMAWVLAALAALALLGVLALHGPDRRQSLVEHQAEGTMKHLATASINSVRASSSAGARSFKRATADRWLLSDTGIDATIPDAASEAIEAGLRLLHNTRPERSFESEAPEFGLSAPILVIVLRSADGQTFEATFGATNPMGLANYVRIRSAGQSGVRLMPVYVAEAWAPALQRAAK